ncbi:MAG: hypothetical protein Q6354_03930 [Candidatus Brocadiales bacterium]|nr:hypothetical protein [Candidatus Brocadiales bacterium]
MKKTITEIRAKIERERASYREREVARKSNPYIESLRGIVVSMESGNANNTVQRPKAVQRLKALLAEMEDSPLVLKVTSEVLKVIEGKNYKERTEYHNAYYIKDRLREADANDEVFDVLNALYMLLGSANHPEDDRLDKGVVAENVELCLCWVINYLEEAKALEDLEPEASALACLAGYGFQIGYGFKDFEEELQEAKAVETT